MGDDRLPAWTLVQTYHVVARGFAQLFAEFDLSPPQFGVLVQLAEGGNPSQAELARAALVRPQSMGELITALIDRGLVERAGPGGRGRRSALNLTDRGRDAVERAWPAVRAFNTPAALGLTDAESMMLDELLRKVATQAGDDLE